MLNSKSHSSLLIRLRNNIERLKASRNWGEKIIKHKVNLKFQNPAALLHGETALYTSIIPHCNSK